MAQGANNHTPFIHSTQMETTTGPNVSNDFYYVSTASLANQPNYVTKSSDFKMVNGILKQKRKIPNKVLRRQWTKEEKLILIRAVQEEEIIWNANIPGHRDHSETSLGWERVLERLKSESGINTNESEARQVFCNMRSQYTAERSKERASQDIGDGDKEGYKSRWKYLNALTFLDDQIKQRGRRQTSYYGSTMDFDSDSSVSPPCMVPRFNYVQTVPYMYEQESKQQCHDSGQPGNSGSSSLTRQLELVTDSQRPYYTSFKNCRKAPQRILERQWNQEEKMTLVEAVHQEPIIWDPTTSQYRDLVETEKAWKKVLHKLKVENGVDTKEAEVKQVFSNLRSQFTTERTKEKASQREGADKVYVSRWKFMDVMKFLDHLYKPRTAKNFPEKVEYRFVEERVPATYRKVKNSNSASNSPPSKTSLSIFTNEDKILVNHFQEGRNKTFDQNGFIKTCSEDLNQPELLNKSKDMKDEHNLVISDNMGQFDNDSNKMIERISNASKFESDSFTSEKPNRSAEDKFGEFIASQLREIRDESLKDELMDTICTAVFETKRKCKKVKLL